MLKPLLVAALGMILMTTAAVAETIRIPDSLYGPQIQDDATLDAYVAYIDEVILNQDTTAFAASEISNAIVTDRSFDMVVQWIAPSLQDETGVD